MVLFEYSLTKIIPSLEKKSSSRFLITLLVPNQSGTNFNVGRKATKDLLQISGVLY